MSLSGLHNFCEGVGHPIMLGVHGKTLGGWVGWGKVCYGRHEMTFE